MSYNKNDQSKKPQRTSQTALHLNIPSSSPKSSPQSTNSAINSPPHNSPQSTQSPHNTSVSPHSIQSHIQKTSSPSQHHQFVSTNQSSIPSLTLTSPHQTITITPQNTITITPINVNNPNNQHNSGYLQKITISNQTITVFPNNISISSPYDDHNNNSNIANNHPFSVNFDGNYDLKEINVNNENLNPLSFLNRRDSKDNSNNGNILINEVKNTTEINENKTETVNLNNNNNNNNNNNINNSNNGSNPNISEVVEMNNEMKLRTTESDKTEIKSKQKTKIKAKISRHKKTNSMGEEIKSNSHNQIIGTGMKMIQSIRKGSEESVNKMPRARKSKSLIPASQSFHNFSPDNSKSSFIDSDVDLRIGKSVKKGKGKKKGRIPRNQSVTDSLSSMFTDGEISDRALSPSKSRRRGSSTHSEKEVTDKKEKSSKKEKVNKERNKEPEEIVIKLEAEDKIENSDHGVKSSQEVKIEKNEMKIEIEQERYKEIEKEKIEKQEEIIEEKKEELIEEIEIKIDEEKKEEKSEEILIIIDKNIEKNIEINTTDSEDKNTLSDQDQAGDTTSTDEVFTLQKKKKSNKKSKKGKINKSQPEVQKDLITVENNLSTPPLDPSLRRSRIFDEYNINRGENKNPNTSETHLNLEQIITEKVKKGRRKKSAKRKKSEILIQQSEEEKKLPKSILVKDRDRTRSKEVFTVRFTTNENDSLPKKILKEKIIFPTKKRNKKSKKSPTNSTNLLNNNNEDEEGIEISAEEELSTDDKNSDGEINNRKKRGSKIKLQNSWQLNSTNFKISVKNGVVTVQNPIYNSGFAAIKQQLSQLQQNYKNSSQSPAALDASKSDLSSFPLIICNHDYLTICNLYSNQLKCLPAEIGFVFIIYYYYYYFVIIIIIFIFIIKLFFFIKFISIF